MPNVQLSKGSRDSSTCLKTESATCLGIETRELFGLSDVRSICIIPDEEGVKFDELNIGGCSFIGWTIDITIHV